MTCAFSGSIQVASAAIAYGDPGAIPKSGVIRLDSGMAPGRRFCTLEGRVRHIIASYEIDCVFLEAPFVQHDKSKFDVQVVRLSYGYLAAITMAAEKEGIGPEHIHLVEPSLWRSSQLGTTRAPKGTKNNREWLKKAAIDKCRSYGWTITSNDQAEACLLWLYGSEMTKPMSTIDKLPLFESATL